MSEVIIGLLLIWLACFVIRTVWHTAVDVMTWLRHRYIFATAPHDRESVFKQREQSDLQGAKSSLFHLEETYRRHGGDELARLLADARWLVPRMEADSRARWIENKKRWAEEARLASIEAERKARDQQLARSQALRQAAFEKFRYQLALEGVTDEAEIRARFEAVALAPKTREQPS